jgi:hypothetical protein
VDIPVGIYEGEIAASKKWLVASKKTGAKTEPKHVHKVVFENRKAVISNTVPIISYLINLPEVD